VLGEEQAVADASVVVGLVDEQLAPVVLLLLVRGNRLEVPCLRVVDAVQDVTMVIVNSESTSSSRTSWSLA
jgi:hypothetical protein